MVLRNYKPIEGKQTFKTSCFTLASTPYEKKDRYVLTPNFSYGFRERSGTFFSAEGLKRFTPYTLNATKCFFADGLYAFSSGGLYRLGNAGFQRMASFSHAPSHTKVTLKSGEEGYLFYDNSDWWYKGESEKRLVGVNAKFACFHYEKLFVWDGERLHFSAPCDPFGWESSLQEAGSVELPCAYGEVVGMCSFSERIFLMRERGVTVFRSFGDNRNMKAVHSPLPCKKIVGNSVASFPTGILFFSEGNLYHYDGNVCTLLAEVEFNPEEAIFDGKRYLARGTWKGEKVLFIYRQDKTYSFLRLDVQCLSESGFLSDGRWLVLSDEEGEPVDRTWEANDLTFASSSPRKRVGELFLEGEGEVSVRLSSLYGIKEKTIALPASFRPSLKGKKFSMRIIGHGAVRIDKVEVKLRDN